MGSCDQQLRIVEQGLGDSNALLHATGEAAQRTFADIREVDHIEKFVNPLFRKRGIKALDRRQIFKKLNHVEIRIHAKIVRQISQG